MNSIQASEIEYVDVVVVGGGIAGIAITEFLSRHSNLTIKVLEKSLKLGNLASGKLEGWFHTGALYSGQDDAQTFINCVNGVEDIINLYTPYFRENCNINLTEKFPNFYSPTIIPNSQGWFNAQPVHIIHPQADAPEISSSRLKSDTVQINIQLNRVLGRLEVAYGKQHNWKNNDNCIAPSYAQVENYEGISCSLRQSNETIHNLCSQFDNSYGIKPSNYEVLHTLDCSMNTSRILKDLVASCLNQGVTFETGVTIDKLLLDRYGPIRLKSLICKTRQGLPKRLKAKLFIFAVGEEFESFLADLQVRARLKRSRSAMVVAYPALVNNNFVRMSTKNRFHFNHFIQQREKGDQKFIYSMLANSGYMRDEEPEDIDIEPILELAERYFGQEKLHSRQLFSYECMKTEFISEEEQKRRYSYWIESNPKSNYLCVLPGKFSFFPTVAYQAYQRIKTLIDFEESSPKIAFDSTTLKEVKEQAKTLVADSYPLQIFRVR
ncbi:MAG: FAD-dependent oxidoreductase [cyanobacterium endosymbiont of Rhopalodia musculus]|uniref:FAD-dependent oxidoreductase n=1 Tax=cyanobacterium endosymbiont of Epithemia clementina EcSB TaxID=3034674 RepID=UPI002480234F|nr:FAD-dependent oxidoreductase [cyanobacterium endosymbiont of Epithemia clementina EcSB]WGT66777.1 FAD-dependent oxidoreductase [cyanobacterium endosymbiont of Epithemia clementina EcSB]